MQEALNEVETWSKEGKAIAIATNVMRDGASLRPLGAKMAMTTSQEIAGSVTGGWYPGRGSRRGTECDQNRRSQTLALRRDRWTEPVGVWIELWQFIGCFGRDV